MDEARRRVAEAPVEVVVTNHVMGLYELAAIHLSAEQPDLHSAALAIDAVACLVDGLGDRLGPDVADARDALANIRLAFVEIKKRASTSASTDAPNLGAIRSGSSRIPRRSAPRWWFTADGSGRGGRRPPGRRGR